MDAITEHLSVIRTLFDAAESRGLLLWLESGWAIDARLGRITREHEDIDIAFDRDKETIYREILETLGFDRYEEMDYGFLSWRNSVLVDSEPCFVINGEYTFETFPSGSCPIQKEGVLDGYCLRCLSWEAMYFEFLGYIHDTPQKQWRDKDFESLRHIEAHLDEDKKRTLKEWYARAML
jgi:2''-aminoglycoside nucleotidyltransferase